MTQGIMSGNSRILLMPYDERWRLLRNIMDQILSARQQDVFKAFQDLESKHLLWDYLHNPNRWFSANGRFANSVIMSVVFGSSLDQYCMVTEHHFHSSQGHLPLAANLRQ